MGYRQGLRLACKLRAESALTLKRMTARRKLAALDTCGKPDLSHLILLLCRYLEIPFRGWFHTRLQIGCIGLLLALIAIHSSAFAQTTPVHRYSFNEVGGATFSDSIGGAPWAGTLPAGGTLAGGYLVLASSSSQYGKLPAGIVSTLNDFTISTWVSLNSTANWSRIFDFGNNTTTYMFLTPQNGSNSRLRFAITTGSSGGEQQITGPSALTPGVWHHIAVTLSGNVGILYLDGSPVGTNSSMTLRPSSLGSTANNYLGKSQWADPYLDGALDDFSIYNVALSAAEIVAIYSQPPPSGCAVNWSDTKQRIDGFGFSSAWCGTLSAAKNNALYGTLGMSLLRIRIDENNNWGAETANSAAAHSFGAKVFGCAWRAPAYMTYKVTNTTATTTNIFTYLSSNYFSSYALWLNQAANAHNLDYVSVKNEPDLYASSDLNLSPDEIRIFCRDDAPLIGRPVTMADAVGFTDSVSDATLNDSSAAANVAIVSGHFYGGGNRVHTNALAKGKPVWMTEHYLSDCATNFAVCLNLAKEISDSMKNQFSAYVGWWAQDGDTNINLANSSGTILKDGYTMGHFSKFIRPGFYRIGATSVGTAADITAYIDAASSNYVIVAINRGNTAITQQFNLAGFPQATVTPWVTSYTQSLVAQAPLTNVSASFTYTLQPSNIVTFVGTPPPAAPTNFHAFAGMTRVNLGWNAVTGAASYNVKRATVSGGPYTVLASATAASFTDTTTVPGTPYYYVVSAVNISGESADSGEASVTIVPLPALAHRYSFNEPAGSTNVTDSAGGLAWTGILPNGGTLSGGQLLLAGASSQYAKLPVEIVNTFTDFTIETWVMLNSTANWCRIFDFGNSTLNYMFLTPQNSVNGRLRFAITMFGNGNEQQLNGTSGLAAGVWYHLAVTHKGNTGVLYVNGAPVNTNAAMTLTPSSLGVTTNNYIGKSQWSDPYFNGLIDEFRIYNVALSGSEIAATYALGPGQVLSTNSPAVGLGSSPTSLTLTWPLASAGYTLQMRTNLVSGNWVDVQSPAPQIVGGQWQVALPVSADTNSIFYRLMK